MHSHVFMCLLVQHLPQMKLDKILDVCEGVRARVCKCAVPARNAEREAPSCEAEAACQCCPSGTDTHGASGRLNRLPG